MTVNCSGASRSLTCWPRATHTLKRVLGAGDLIMLAIGAVIGAGIFSSIGTAAAGRGAPNGEVVRYGAGPALVLSFILLGVVVRPRGALLRRAGRDDSAGRQRLRVLVRTLGELVAWIIGWDLILEYAVGNIAVAIAWSDYFKSLLAGFGVDAARVADARLSHGAAQRRSGGPRPAADRAAHRRHPDPRSTSRCGDRDADHLAAATSARKESATRQQHHGGGQAAGARLLRRASARCTSNPANYTSVRAERLGRASIRARRSSSSPTSASTRSRPPPKRRRTRSATCRSASSAGSRSARSSTSSSASVLTGLVPYQAAGGRRSAGARARARRLPHGRAGSSRSARWSR